MSAMAGVPAKKVKVVGGRRNMNLKQPHHVETLPVCETLQGTARAQVKLPTRLSSSSSVSSSSSSVCSSASITAVTSRPPHVNPPWTNRDAIVSTAAMEDHLQTQIKNRLQRLATHGPVTTEPPPPLLAPKFLSGAPKLLQQVQRDMRSSSPPKTKYSYSPLTSQKMSCSPPAIKSSSSSSPPLKASSPKVRTSSSPPTPPSRCTKDSSPPSPFTRYTKDNLGGLPPKGKPRQQRLKDPGTTARAEKALSYAKQRSRFSEDESPTTTSPTPILQSHEPTRLQSILHRRVSLMEMKNGCTSPDTSDANNNGNVTNILEGRLVNLPPVTSKTVKVFLSSTFSDMVQERNALMEFVYPKLKDLCREQFGLEFQVVDLRWGVREEAQDDHATIDVCLQEIENCKKSSIGPSFVAFIGQKYGYRPFPPRINAGEFSTLYQCVVEDGQDITLLDQWYKIDRNTIPSVCVLQPISSILKHYNDKDNSELRERDQKTWYAVFIEIQQLLRRAAELARKKGQISERKKKKVPTATLR